MIAIGIPVLLESFARFALQGQGTPAPVAPTRHLVVTGSYRYARNPIYLAVTAIVLGQGLFFGNVTLLVYSALLALGFTSSCWPMRSRRCGRPSGRSLKHIPPTFPVGCRGYSPGRRMHHSH